MLLKSLRSARVRVRTRVSLSDNLQLQRMYEVTRQHPETTVPCCNCTNSYHNTARLIFGATTHSAGQYDGFGSEPRESKHDRESDRPVPRKVSTRAQSMFSAESESAHLPTRQIN